MDPAGEGVVDYSLFMRSVLGEMSEHRKKLVRKVGVTFATMSHCVNGGPSNAFHNIHC